MRVDPADGEGTLGQVDTEADNADLARYYRRSPAELELKDLCRYCEYLAVERELSAASCRLALKGIRFLYLNVLERPALDVPIPVPKRPQRIPELWSRAEVARILAACATPKYQMMLTLCYGCRLRLSQLLAVRVSDIDGSRGRLRIEQGKGAKDRPCRWHRRCCRDCAATGWRLVPGTGCSPDALPARRCVRLLAPPGSRFPA